MSTDSSQQRLDQAIRLSQLGDKEQSRKILLQLIQENAKNEYAWLWLVDVCDSDKERKAILSRGLKLNPQSKLLKTAMKRFVDTGDLRSITESLDDLKAEVAVSIAIDAKREATTPATPFITTADLDWIELDQEKNEPEQIDTISDDEFSRLSEKFFGSGEVEEASAFSTRSKPAAGSDDQTVEPPDELVQFDPFDDGDPDFAPRHDTQETINSQELIQKEKKFRGIEDELKGALTASEPQKSQKKRFRLPYLRRISQRVLVVLVSAFWLILFVLAGLFLVQYLDLAPRGEDELAQLATDLPLDVLEVDSPSSTETPQPEETGEPSPMVFSTVEIIEPEPVYAPINADNFEQMGSLDTLDHATVAFFNQELDLLALIHPRRIQVLESLGDVLWEFQIPVERPNYLGGTFNKNGSQLAFFTDTMQVEIWSVERGTRLSTFRLSVEQQTIYGNIPYLPANTRVQLAYSEDGNWLAAAFWGGISVWNVRSGEVIHWYALPDNILVSSFNANLDISFVVAFPISSNRLVYGGRENIFLVDLVDDKVIQNWKTQYVGSLAFIDEDTVIETGYSLGNLSAYLTVWGADEIFPTAKRSSLSSQRGFRLPNYAYFTDEDLLVYEVEREPGGSIALEVYSLAENGVINIFDLNTQQPLFAIGNFGDNLVSIWLDQPQEAFGARDTVQLWDIQLGTVVAQCDKCTYAAGRFATSFQLYALPGQEFIVLQARGAGIQWLGLVSSPVE